MRDPSIHITESKLKEILHDLMPEGVDVNKMALMITKKAKVYSLNNRKLDVTNGKTEKKVNRIMASPNADAELFSLLLLHTRRRLKHRGLTQIKQNSRDWLTVKEIVSLANEFCEAFDLDKREGYIKFIEIGISKMSKFMLVKFTPMGSSIIETFQCMLELQDDDQPMLTEKVYNFYQKTIISRTGISMEYKDNPDKYVHFYRVRLLANKLKIDPLVFIKAQFYALEWRNGYPDPIQLTNDKAIQNLNKYLYEKGTPQQEVISKKIDFSKIKKMGGDDD